MWYIHIYNIELHPAMVPWTFFGILHGFHNAGRCCGDDVVVVVVEDGNFRESCDHCGTFLDFVECGHGCYDFVDLDSHDTH